jgi:hypothetical protein
LILANPLIPIVEAFRYAYLGGRSVLPYYFYCWWDAGGEAARALRKRLRIWFK